MTFKDQLKGNIFYVRIIATITSWIGVLLRFYVQIEEKEFILEPFKFFTIQTNIMVATWLTLSVVYKDNRDGMNTEKMDQLYGLIRGSITAFITLTWLGYWALLGPTAEYSSNAHLWSSNINHYIIPIYFILDWFVTENKRYDISIVKKSLLYPLLYIAFALIFQFITGDSIYGFFNVEEKGAGSVATMCVALFIGFAIFSLTYFGLNKLLVKNNGDESN